MKRKIFATLIVALVLFASCGGGRENSERFVKNPVDNIIRDMPTDRIFSIILYDMNVEGNFSERFYHQYRIIEEVEAGNPTERTTEWMEVGERYFKQHQDDMGMELASRGADGELVKSVSPAGYNNYVGNEKYGQWKTHRDGYSFWEFYGQYAFMSTMFNMFTYPVRRSYYDDYRGNYYGRGRSYYGPRTTSGRSYYGTNSDYNRNSRSNSTWSNNRSNFKNRVNRRAQRSSTSGSSTRSSSSSRTSRSSSRYRGSSSRSRGGGYGK